MLLLGARFGQWRLRILPKPDMWQDIPPELVFQVLRHFLPGLKLSTLEPHLFPWYIGHICSTWRSVFLSSPQFWARFIISSSLPQSWEHHEDALLTERTVALSNICLQRSKDHPLSFEFTLSMLRLQDSPSFWRHLQILEMLVAESHRWQHVYLSMMPTDVAILRQAQGRFDQLRTLRFPLGSQIRQGILQQEERFNDLFEDAPLLSIISVNNISTWKLNWSSMTTIHLFSLAQQTPREFVEVLGQTKRLERLVLLEPFRSPLPIDIEPVTLPFLKFLSINSVIFLPLIISPNIEQLWARNNYFGCVELFSEEFFPARFSRFASAIQRLETMTLIPLNIQDASILFRHIPKVDHLSLYAEDVEILGYLASHCPNAHHIKQITVTLWSFLDTELADAFVMLTTWNKKEQSGEVGTFQNLPRFIFICTEYSLTV